MLDKIIFLSHAVATLMMLGIMWFVQLAYYPLLKNVGRKEFVAYEKEYIQKIMPYSIFILSTEFITGILLLWIKPPNVLIIQVWLGLLLLAIVWLSTWFVQVPFHKKLSLGFDKNIHNLLVKSNWVRTFAWTARGFWFYG